MLKGTLGTSFLLSALTVLVGIPHAVAQTLPAATVPPATMSCDYENQTNCSQGNTNLQCATSNRATNVTTARSNAYSIALTTLSGDSNISGSGSWERCDLSFGLQSKEGTDEWWWSSVYFPDGFHVPTGSDQCYDIGPEFHSVYSGDTQPNFEIQLCPNGWHARVYGGAGTPQTDGPGRVNFAFSDPYGLPVVAKNKWYDFLMHTKWSYTSAGITTLYINGTKVIDYNGPNLYQGYNVYMKLPNYHGPYGVSSTLYYDRTVRGPTQASVAPTTSVTSTTTTTTTSAPPPPTSTTTATSTSTTGTTTGTTTSSSTTSSAFPSSYTATPYTGSPIPLPGTFAAANFDLGGQNIAYYDTTPGNLGGQYRTSEDVDIISSCDPNAISPYVVSNFATAEWMNYTVNVATTGSYVFQLLASNNYSAGQPAFHIEVDGIKATGSVPVPLTGSWCTFKPVAAPAIPLTAGKHVVKIYSDQQYFNLEAVKVSSYLAGYQGKPYTGTPIAVPGTFKAADFDLGGQYVAYYDSTSTNLGGQYRPNDAVDIVTSCDATPTAPYVVNNFTTAEWMNYTINAASTGSYMVKLRTSNNYSANTAFHIEVDGVRVTGPVTVPLTGGWCNFQTVSTPAFPMTAGTHVLKVVSDQQYQNVESISVSSSP